MYTQNNKKYNSYNFEEHFEFARDWENKNGKYLLKVSDWNTDPNDVVIPLFIVQQAIIESMKSITHYAETISVVKACYQIQEDLKEVYGMQFDKQAHIHLFGNATQSIFCVMCALKQIVRRPSALVINPSYYSIKNSAKLFNIPVNEMWRKSRENFYIDIDLIDKLRLRYKTNILILTDPVYSCGKSLDDNDFSQLIDYCMYHGIWIVVDMAFGGLSWSDENKIWVDINKWTRNNYQKL